LVEEDQVKQALGEGALSVGAKGSDLNKTIEFLRSEFLFEKAISKLNTSVSVFSEGKLLTKDLYKATSFQIIPIQIKDSSICGVRIDVKYVNNLVELKYSMKGKEKVVRGVLNGKFKNEDFEELFKVFAPVAGNNMKYTHFLVPITAKINDYFRYCNMRKFSYNIHEIEWKD
jgi:hypothetical protein